MKSLRTSVYSLFFILAANAFAQTGTSEYQCLSDGSLNGGLLIITTDRLQIFAKHKNGIVSEFSGIIGYRNGRTLHPKYVKNLESMTYAQLNVIGMSVADYLQNTGFSDYQKGIENPASGDAPPTPEEEAADRDDIDKGAYPSLRANTDPNARPGDKVPPKAGDMAVATTAGARVPPRNPIPKKNGDLVYNGTIVSFSARLNQQGNISQLSYRDGQKPTTSVPIDVNNPINSDEVYAKLSGMLNGIKTQALRCPNNSAATRTTGNRVPVQSTLRSVKPTAPQAPSANGSALVSPAQRATGAAAK